MSKAINPLCECGHIKTLHVEGDGRCYATVFTRSTGGTDSAPCQCTAFTDAGVDAGPRDLLGERVQLLHGLRTRLDDLQVDVMALAGEHSVFLARLHAAERIPEILRRATSWLVTPDGATIQLAQEDAAELDEALAEFGYPSARGADECPRCHGDGSVVVGGRSLNPSSGVLVPDPQMAHDETCPDCAGSGRAEGADA